jgi:hypothetical protein
MNRLFMICFILVAAFTLPAGADDCTRYGDETYGYSICVPAGWKKSYRDIGYKHILTLSRGSSEIVSSASRMDDEEKAKWNSWRKWYVKGIGGSLMSIIETREARAGRDATIKLIVFQYSKNGATLLQRSMLMKYGDNLLILECRAPVGSFSAFTDLFNRVMSSIEISTIMKGNSMDVLKQQQQAERKKTQRETRGKEAIKGGTETGRDGMRDLENKGIIERIEKGGARPDDSAFGASRDQKEAKPVRKEEPKKQESQVKRTEEPKPDNSAESAERKKVIEAELKKLEDLENKGVIEKVEESGK